MLSNNYGSLLDIGTEFDIALGFGNICFLGLGAWLYCPPFLNLRSHGKSSDGIYEEYTEPMPSAQEIDSNSAGEASGTENSVADSGPAPRVITFELAVSDSFELK